MEREALKRHNAAASTGRAPTYLPTYTYHHTPQLREFAAGSDLMEPSNPEAVMAIEVINFLWTAVEEFLKVGR